MSAERHAEMFRAAAAAEPLAPIPVPPDGERGEVIIGISGQSSADGHPGAAAPFTHTVLVYDRAEPESTNIAVLLHEISHLFGASHSTDPASVMCEHPRTHRFDADAADMIHLMREFDFAK